MRFLLILMLVISILSWGGLVLQLMLIFKYIQAHMLIMEKILTGSRQEQL